MNIDFLRLQKAFTLLELLITVVIIGVLAALAIPRLNYSVERMRSAEGVAILQALLNAQKSYHIDHGVYSSSYDDLDIDIPVPKNFNPISTSNVNSVNPLAFIERSTGAYTLMVNEDGSIECSNSSTNDYCSKIGY